MEAKRKFHIVSVGISIVRGLQERRVLPMARPDQLENMLSNPRTFEKIRKDVKPIVQSEAPSISAEINAMWEFLEAREVHEVHLVATATGAGRLCQEILRDYLEEVWGVEFSGGVSHLIDYYRRAKQRDPEEASIQFAEDLRKLFDHLIVVISEAQARGMEVLINATGGFKAEMAVFSLLGNLFLVRTYYKHETFGRVVFLPPLIPPDLVAGRRELLELAEAGEVVGKKFEELYSSRRNEIDRLVDYGVLEFVFPQSWDVPEGYRGPVGYRLTAQGRFWLQIAEDFRRGRGS